MPLGLGRLKLVPVVAAGMLAIATGISAGDLPSQFAGNLLGMVVDSLGTPQMGASVTLFDRYDRMVHREVTGADGRFGFLGLAPSSYSIRASADSLLPAMRNKIAIRAGLSSVLQIRMAAIFSSIEVKYTKPTTAMTDDWKWVLRASAATRPVTRVLAGASRGRSASAEDPAKIFTGTRGLVSLSAGDAGSLLSDSSIADFGTSFALATTMYGRNQLTVSGIFGQSLTTGMPTMGLRATYSRSDPEGLASLPEITVMAQQFYLPGRLMSAPGPGGAQAVRSSSLSYYDTVDFFGGVHLEYGSAFDAISYFDHVNRVSPYARLTTALGDAGSLAVTYSSGGSPNELYLHQYGDGADLADTIGAIASVPSFSMRSNRLALERTQNYEVGYSKVAGRRTYAISAFYESVNNGRLHVLGDLSALNAADLLPDISTTTTLLNMGHYNRNGVMASIDQKLNDNVEFGIAGGTMGGFLPTSVGTSGSAFFPRSNYPVASVNVRLIVPSAGTRIITEYEYVAGTALVPEHIFSTQRLYAEPGLNIIVRQPLPSLFGMGKLELSGDIRNLLAQGYLPLGTADGHQTMLLACPRTVRGGLNIIF
ncbi:MAG TPA: carboxypeptidase-like regulatory domain-containing protein [Bryobacteraceae bacterium]|nr:carboxypeptidase-like regulatory domain-containing protein [Bryobacteraceae bacterium]